MSLSKDITKFYNRSSKKIDLSDQKKEGNREHELKLGKKKVASEI